MIPRIIHQIWSEKYKPIPQFFTILAETWKEKHPEWKYIYWNEEEINNFMQKEYPHLCDFYYSMPFDIQRWDAVRFLILYKMGGMYADFDYECLENMEPLLENRTCCIGLEPETHRKMYDIPYVLNGALFACVPEAPYLKKVIDRIFSETTKQFDQTNKPVCILHTTGPLMLSEIYENLAPEEKQSVYLIPAKYVTPFDIRQIAQLKAGVENEELENCLQEAYAVHYFANTWIPELSSKDEKRKYNIGIIYMATGLYTMFWEKFYTSCEKYLCTDTNKKYFVFTDDKSLLSLKIPNVTFIQYEDKGWLVNVSSKCKCILSIGEEIMKLDYTFYFNANYEALAPIYTHDILPDESDNYLAALCFYKGANNDMLPYDRNKDSLAYIPFGQGKYYFLASFFGGRSSEFLKLCEWSNKSVFADLEKGIVTKTFDESYLNKYLVDIPPKVIDMVFGTPEGWAPVEQCKGIFYNKDKLFGAEKVYQLREPFELHLPYLYNEKYEIAPLSIVEANGGLGTQMFQYAFMLERKYSDAQGRYYLDMAEDNCNLANVFVNLDKEDFISEELRQNVANTPARCIKHITDLNSNYPVKNDWKLVTCYRGHWQSEKYFDGIVTKIKKCFQFDEARLNNMSKALLNNMNANNTVAVHIRRRENESCDNQLLYNGICAQEYYLKAINKIKAETGTSLQIYLFGNDKEWLKENIFIPEGIIVDWNHEQDDWQDMYLMSRCKYHIISNSSFSWWAAWLCEIKNKKIIFPNVWCNNKNITDVIPAEWMTDF